MNLQNLSKGVLVHCFAGSSRSVSTILAYLLQEKVIRTIDEGIELIAGKGGSPNPNYGFMEQLELWIEMGNKISETNGNYKKYQMKVIQEIMMLDEGKEQIAKIVSTEPEYVIVTTCSYHIEYFQLE